MGTIKIKDIKVYANHGCLDEEDKIGSDYLVNVKIKTSLSKSAQTDDLNDTIDYCSIYDSVYEEMKKRSKLLEAVVQRIIDSILKKHPQLSFVKVTVAKQNPPIGGETKEVSVSSSYSKKTN